MFKKILSLIVLSAALQSTCYAHENVSFVYINGSNNNDAKMRTWFVDGVNTLHPKMKKQIEHNKHMKTLFLQKGDVSINAKPVVFFWGDKSQTDLDFVKRQLDISKALSPTISYAVREVLASFLHDAIWVQKKHNMIPILNELNDSVKNEYKKGNNTVLYGYSAGSFITYEYLFNKLPYLNMEKLFENTDISNEFKEFVKDNPRKNSCISGIAQANIGIVSADGHLMLDKYEDRLKENYLKVDESTDKACMPEGAVKGIVNYASPLVLFYSDLADPEYELTFYNKLMMKYVMEKGMFWITVNYREDPLGFPSTRNLTATEMEQLAEVKIKNPSGFIYDYSSVWSKRPFFTAHTAYWKTGKTLPKAVVKAYVNGHKFQYDVKFQQKVQKSNRARIKYEAL